jgi:cyclopropane-fatty-acyl-phospholipid synthase
MWQRLFERTVRTIVRHGTLRITMPGGRVLTAGDGTGDPVAIRLADPALPRRILINPDLAVGEGYMDGTLLIEDDDLRGFLGLAMKNLGASPGIDRIPGLWLQRPAALSRRAGRRWRQWNTALRARANVAHHYDLSAELYDLFLDADKQYSCAYFADPAMTLEAAQAAKKRHIAAKLLIEPGMHVLDIGCGWGGMALTLARDHGARVTGVTLSGEQHRIATARAREAGLEDRVTFRLTDYRNVAGTFDRIVSVGMFEHVGTPHYAEYFATLSDRLEPSGVALVHTIGRMRPPGVTSPWIDRYIFPGGYIPALSETVAPIETENLYITDIEIWRLHYAETLRHWHDRFTARIDRARALYDDRFCRMWRYYLVAAEMTFRHNRQCVFQLQLAHRQEAVPLTRDYLHAPRAGAAQTHAQAAE